MDFSLKKGEEFVKTYYDSETDIIKRQELTMEIFQVIYVNLEKFGVYFFDEDLRSDFLLDFYYKIPGILKKYNPNLSSFYTYLTNTIHFSFLSFRCNNAKSEIKEKFTAIEEDLRWHNLFDEFMANGDFNFYAAESGIDYCKAESTSPFFLESKLTKEELTRRRSIYFNMPIKHRKFFLLACKACLFLDDDLIYKISIEIKMDPQFLLSIIQDLKNICLKKFEKMKFYSKKRNKYYIKRQFFRYILDKNVSNKYQSEKIKRSLEYNHNLWLKMRKLNKTQIKSPSSTDIQKCINVYKGTIDKNIAKTLKMWYTPKNEDIFSIR